MSDSDQENRQDLDKEEDLLLMRTPARTASSEEFWSGPLLKIQSPMYKHQGSNGLVAGITSGAGASRTENQNQNQPEEIWKKTAQVKAQHEKFLGKLETTERLTTDARFIDPSVAASLQNHYVLGEPTKESDETQTPKGFSNNPNSIPWRKKDPSSNSADEKERIFKSFQLTGGEMPSSPPAEQQQQSEPRVPSRGQRPGQNSRRDKNLTFVDHAEIRSISPQPLYGNVQPKVDTGLNQMKKQTLRYSSNGVPLPENKTKHIPLTIGSRLPTNFNGQVNYDLFKSERAAKIAQLTARLYPTQRQKSRTGTTYLPPQSQQQRHKTYDASRSNTNGARSSGNTNTSLSNYNYNYSYTNNQIQNQNQNQKILGKPSNSNGAGNSQQIQILRAPPSNNPSTASIRQETYPNFPPAPLPHASQAHSQAQAQSQSQNPANQGQGQKIAPRRLRPSQLMPLHIPGPKYDNIYIGPYSGSDSDPDHDDDMDHPHKSRKR